MTKNKVLQDRFLSYYKPVHGDFERFCRARVFGRMDYEDLMHEALLIAWRKFDKVQSPDAFFSFLCGITVRILSNDRQKRKEEHADETELMRFVSDHGNTDASADVYFLHQALATLSDDQRECLILFEISGFSIREIAAMQDASESAVKKRLERGRQNLKKILTRKATHQTGEEGYHG